MRSAAQDPIALRGAPAPKTAPAVQAQVTEQWLACLAAEGRHQDLDMLVARMPDGGRAAAHYYLAVALAADGDLVGALDNTRRSLALRPDHAAARRLAFKLLVSEAAECQRRQDWKGLDATLTEALAYAPTDGSADRELERFANGLPAACMRNNRRVEAVKLWERALKERGPEPRLFHNLALLHYWWAIREEEQPAERAARTTPPWEAAIAYWTVAVQSDAFWTEWKSRREQAWGLRLTDADFTQLQSGLLEEQLHRRFQDRASQFLQEHRPADARRYEAYLAAALRERRSAETWRQALAVLDRPGAGEALPKLLTVPGGYLFFERMGLLDALRARAARLAAQAPRDPCLVELAIQFSPNGLGLASAVIEARGKFENGLAMLDALPKDVAESVEATYLRVVALAGRAGEFHSRQEIAASMRLWAQAYAAAKKALDQKGLLLAFRGPLTALIETTVETATKAVQREATRLKNADKLEEAIKLLEQAHGTFGSSGIRDYLCLYYCDRGDTKLGEKKLEAARTEFQRALNLDMKHQRARKGMGVAYNNESVSLSNPTREITLLEKALEYDPDNGTAKKNLAVACNARGVQILNGLNAQYPSWSSLDEAIKLFRRAAPLLRPSITDSMLDAVKNVGEIGTDQLESALANVDSEDLRLVLKHLGIAAGMRRRVRGY